VIHRGWPVDGLPCCRAPPPDVRSRLAAGSGYYGDPQKTADVLDASGWLRTGDIGRISKDGMLQLVDRVENIFKLSQVSGLRTTA